MKDPKKYYESNINKNNIKIKELERKISVFATVRLLIVVLAIALIYYFYKIDKFIYVYASFIVPAVAFIVIAIIHNNNINARNRYLLRLKYNEMGLKRINGEWKEFTDSGKEYIDLNHNFTSDLDIFGENSLFKWINTTKSYLGRKKLSEILMIKTLPDKYEIMEMQEALKELSEKRAFCEDIYVQFNDRKKKSIYSIEDLLNWMERDEKISFTVKYVPYLFIAITCIFLYLVVAGKVPVNYLILDLFINYLVVKLLTKNLSDSIKILLDNKNEVIQYSSILNIIGKEEFNIELY